jgi:hypothetical protein
MITDIIMRERRLSSPRRPESPFQSGRALGEMIPGDDSEERSSEKSVIAKWLILYRTIARLIRAQLDGATLVSRVQKFPRGDSYAFSALQSFP